MTTPNGGAYSTVVAMLCGVEIDNPALADYLEITEWSAEGVAIARTYSGTIVDGPGEVDTSLSTVEQDEYLEPENSDAIKLSWDVYDRNGLVTSLAGLLDALGLNRDREGRETVANMTSLPVWNVAPASLKSDVATWLASPETA